MARVTHSRCQCKGCGEYFNSAKASRSERTEANRLAVTARARRGAPLRPLPTAQPKPVRSKENVARGYREHGTAEVRVQPIDRGCQEHGKNARGHCESELRRGLLVVLAHRLVPRLCRDDRPQAPLLPVGMFLIAQPPGTYGAPTSAMPAAPQAVVNGNRYPGSLGLNGSSKHWFREYRLESSSPESPGAEYLTFWPPHPVVLG